MRRWQRASAPIAWDLAAFGDDSTAAAYAETLLALPEMEEWTAGAETEIEARKAG
jgi:hypothetical protein